MRRHRLNALECVNNNLTGKRTETIFFALNSIFHGLLHVLGNNNNNNIKKHYQCTMPEFMNRTVALFFLSSLFLYLFILALPRYFILIFICVANFFLLCSLHAVHATVCRLEASNIRRNARNFLSISAESMNHDHRIEMEASIVHRHRKINRNVNWMYRKSVSCNCDVWLSFFKLLFEF